jgi:hypothetical protein
VEYHLFHTHTKKRQLWGKSIFLWILIAYNEYAFTGIHDCFNFLKLFDIYVFVSSTDPFWTSCSGAGGMQRVRETKSCQKHCAFHSWICCKVFEI